MAGPVRKPVAPVEATQELQALDVIELVEALKPKLASAPRKSLPSNSSIAPVGLDLVGSRDDSIDEEADATMGVRLPSRRRLRGIVVGAVAGCGLILLAAVIARAGHASSEPSSASTPATTAPAATASPSPGAPANAATSPASSPASSPVAATAPGDVGSTGTVRLDRPALAGRVWLDGKKLTTKSALVSCGTHQIKVGLKRAHSIDVPCGGEIGVSK
jgi:hypothetical protein